MESRRVVKNRNSLYFCIPSAMAEAMKIEKGDRCQFFLVPGYGLLVRKEGDGSKESIPLEGLANLQQEADQIFHETRRKIRGLQNQAIDIIWMRITGLLFKHGPAIPCSLPAPSKDTQELLPHGEKEDAEEHQR